MTVSTCAMTQRSAFTSPDRPKEVLGRSTQQPMTLPDPGGVGHAGKAGQRDGAVQQGR